MRREGRRGVKARRKRRKRKERVGGMRRSKMNRRTDLGGRRAERDGDRVRRSKVAIHAKQVAVMGLAKLSVVESHVRCGLESRDEGRVRVMSTIQTAMCMDVQRMSTLTRRPIATHTHTNPHTHSHTHTQSGVGDQWVSVGVRKDGGGGGQLPGNLEIWWAGLVVGGFGGGGWQVGGG